GLTVDHAGSVYMVGGAGSFTGISTSGSHQEFSGGGTSDGFIAKFDLCNLTTVATGKKASCLFDTASYKAIDHGNAFQWTVINGHILSGSGTDSITVQWASTGNGYVKVFEVAISG